MPPPDVDLRHAIVPIAVKHAALTGASTKSLCTSIDAFFRIERTASPEFVLLMSPSPAMKACEMEGRRPHALVHFRSCALSLRAATMQRRQRLVDAHDLALEAPSQSISA